MPSIPVPEDNEDKLAAGTIHRSYARAKKYRDQERALVQGMVIALTYVLGKPFAANIRSWE